MPPLFNTRYQFCRSFNDQNGVWYLEVPKPFRFTNETDNFPYFVKTGDNLPIIAYRHYRGFSGAPQLWRAIAEFNDIIDATETLEVNRLLILPSLRWIKEVFLSPPDDYKSIIANIGLAS